MSKKNIIVFSISFVVVAAIYYYLYSDSFRKEHIQISYTFRPTPYGLRHPPADGEPNRIIIFALGHAYNLTSVKVLSVAELQTNKYAHPLWELVSESNSVPVRTFNYGMQIRGMHPSIKGDKPASLDLNTPYRVIVEAKDRIEGEHDFTITEDDHVVH